MSKVLFCLIKKILILVHFSYIEQNTNNNDILKDQGILPLKNNF